MGRLREVMDQTEPAPACSRSTRIVDHTRSPEARINYQIAMIRYRMDADTSRIHSSVAHQEGSNRDKDR